MNIDRRLFDSVTLYTTVIDRADTDSPRNAERRAVAALAEAAFGPGVEISHRPDGSPYINKEGIYISVSHSRHHAALAVAAHEVGIDIEQQRTQLIRIAGRFLSAEEQKIYNTPALILRAWTLKEASYKALRPDTPATKIALPPAAGWRIVYSGPHPAVPDAYLSIVRP